jgi:hypothetical protein
VKKLLALMAVGGLLALATGCPPATTSEPPKTSPGATGTGHAPPTADKTPPVGTTDKDKAPAATDKDKTPPAADKDKTPPATDKDKTPAATEPIKGKVTKAEGNKITVEGKEYTIPESAKVTVDGAADKKASDIKEGNMVTITEKDGKVTAVDVKTK